MDREKSMTIYERIDQEVQEIKRKFDLTDPLVQKFLEEKAHELVSQRIQERGVVEGMIWTLAFMVIGVEMMESADEKVSS